jgi:hypothetical protein
MDTPNKKKPAVGWSLEESSASEDWKFSLAAIGLLCLAVAVPIWLVLSVL